MVIDSSAIVAVALLESTWKDLSVKALLGPSIVAATTLLEVHMVLRSRLGQDSDRALETVLTRLNIVVVPFESQHLREARIAFDRYGKGRHPAALNFGDCISYALCKVSGQPLLFVGDDFALTDIQIT